MMKKLLLLGTAFLAINFAVKAQTVTVNDTMRYFFNKQFYKLPPATVHPVFKCTAALTTNTAITHVGSIFHNSDSIIVLGLQTQVLRPAVAASYQLGVAFRMYLCNVVAGVPVLPPIDSLLGHALATAQNTVLSAFGQYVGGTFNTPRKIGGDFAVLVRNVSTDASDTVLLFRTAGYTPTSTGVPNSNKFGEGLGVVRNAGTFHKTTNYSSPGFGAGTDYEFCIAPIVQYTFTTSQNESPVQSGACCWQVFTNTNTTNALVGNQQFNFDEFFRVFRPFDPNSFPSSFVADSVFAWNVGDGTPTFYTAHGVDSVHLAFLADKCNQFYTGTFISSLKTSWPGSPTYTSGITFTSSTVWCGGDTAGTGIPQIGALANLKIYPNPTSDRTTISGLQGSNTILVYDMVGQLVSTQMTDKELYVVDLTRLPRGNYMIRINSTQNGSSRVAKIFKE